MTTLSERPIWRPYTQEKSAPPSIELIKAQGAHLHTKDGRRLLDGISSWWLISHGHCQPQIVEAIQRQAAQMDQVIFANFTHEPAEEVAELLIEMTPQPLRKVFFSDNGSTAVEVAMKMALQACSQMGRPNKQKFLAFASAYHGDTVGAMSVSGPSPFNRPYRPTLFDVIRSEHPTLSTAKPAEFTRHFELLLNEHHDSIAAVIVEPLVQGAGGMVMWPELALKKIAQLCHDLDVLLIFDEVMTGFGRTGTTFALDRLEVVPDFLCLSKGLTGGSLPLAVTLTTDAIYEAFWADEKSRLFFHGHSFTANPISCAAAAANLKLLKDAEFFTRLQTLELTNRHALEQLQKKIPINDARVCGTIGAFEVGALAGLSDQPRYLSEVTNQLTQLAMQKELFVRPLGNTVYLMPPYCTEPSELERAWETIGICLQKLI